MTYEARNFHQCIFFRKHIGIHLQEFVSISLRSYKDWGHKRLSLKLEKNRM